MDDHTLVNGLLEKFRVALITQDLFEPFNHLRRLVDHGLGQRLQFVAGNGIKVVLLFLDVGNEGGVF
jgi:hypothetical protein